jgi:hypothetical protein
LSDNGCFVESDIAAIDAEIVLLTEQWEKAHNSVVTATARAARADQRERAAEEKLSDTDRAKALLNAIKDLQERRENPALTGHITTCCRGSLTDSDSLCS